jgi:hypothetical protein
MSRDTFVAVDPRWYASNLGGIILTGVVAALSRRRLLRWLFWGAVAIHVSEAAYSYKTARDAGFTESAPKWALQTLAVGFPSLIALRTARDDSAWVASGDEFGPER